MADSQQKLKQVTLQGLKTKRNTRTKKKKKIAILGRTLKVFNKLKIIY